MKKTTIAITSMLLAFFFSSASAVKIGVFDVQKIVSESQMTIKLNKEIEDKFQPIKEELIKIQKVREGKIIELQKNDAVLKQSQKEKLKADILSLEQEYQTKGQNYQVEFQTAQAEFSNKFTTRLEEEIKKIAEKDKLDVVFQKQAVAYVAKKNSSDLTERLIKSLK